MEAAQILAFLHRLEALKCNTRHSWTSSGRQESVAEHTCRLAIMALLLRDAFPQADMDRVLRMCLLHDWGEAVTGDIPAFEKSDRDEETEENAVLSLLAGLSSGLQEEYTALFREIWAQETAEARIFRALDQLEAVIQHNEADLSTWLPLERELNLTYGQAECAGFPSTAQLRALCIRETEQKLANSSTQTRMQKI